jgi:replicative DNA helicase
VEDLSADVFVLKHREGVEMVVIDYLQLMDCYNSFKIKTLDRVGRVSTYVARMGNKLQLPILMLSQLSRSVEIRGGAKRPIMSDLRESGQIEQDAVTITFIYRPEYYNILEDETGRSLKGLTELIIAKHRIDGSRTGKKIELWFNSGTGEFTGDDPSDFHMGSQPDPFTNPISQKPDINTNLPF